MNRDGEPPVRSVLHLRIPIYSCVIDALWEGTETMKMTGLLNDIRHAVRGMVVKQGILLAGMGVAVGLVAAGAMSRVMGSLLFGVSATDPVTYGTVAIALIVVALAASWIPAMRAGGVNPSNALRAD
jgi:putative ABC transport system permease protein